MGLASQRARRRGGIEITADALLYALRESYSGPSWHGPSTRAALRGITASLAQWKLEEQGHCIWELVLHLAYTRHRSLFRTGQSSAGSVPHRLATSWWPHMPERRDAAGWAADIQLLSVLDDDLRRAISALPPRIIDAPRGTGVRTLGEELMGWRYTIATTPGRSAYWPGSMREVSCERYC